jgi:hypothetical protein
MVRLLVTLLGASSYSRNVKGCILHEAQVVGVGPVVMDVASVLSNVELMGVRWRH